MTKEEFDNYRFSINTEVRVFSDPNIWDKVVEVDFEKRTIGIERGQIYPIKLIVEIRK